MPMTNVGMSNAIKEAVIAQKGAPPTAGAADLQKFCDAMGAAVVAYIQTNATVSVTSSGTVTSGPGSGGLVATTGSGTVS